ncbi:MAG TPA: type IV pilin protein, partial [Gammaproteobacteria bacterium]|nr:type IV pilin protein [Gammaproteobacteria bacterium]
ELLIVVVIIGILSSVALGYYRSNVIASNRTEGRSALQTAAGTLEKCRSLYGSYNNANCNYADFTSETGLYDVTSAIAATSFTLTATPVAGGRQADDGDCTSMTLTNTGIKGGAGANSAECW